jgi:hypothetical protein
MKNLHRFRQIHLDFHTALEVDAVGNLFDAETFVETLQTGCVDTINIFAKCHHGYSYYPTKTGTMHPKLKFDLLGCMIESLHRADIRCPVYVSVKWDDLAAINHPEWVCVNKEGKLVMRPVLSGEWGWSTMDVSSGYADYFMSQIEELIDLYGSEIDGWWFDICAPVPNYSPWGMDRMRKAGVNLEDDQAVRRYARQQDLKFFERVSRYCHQKLPERSIYYNGTTDAAMGEMAPYMTHYEVESLPTSGDWGYMHYPVFARQARSYGKEVIGMTGRFHRSWADFGGLKTQDQLDYECGVILSAGGRICVGDQLHPHGVLDPAVYRLVGKSFERVKALEPYLYDAQPAVEAALISATKPETAMYGIGELHPDVDGAAQMLLEAGIQFDIVDESIELDRYQTVFVPDSFSLSPRWLEKLNAFLASGGKLVVSGTGALDRETGQFQLEEIPVTYRGPAPTKPSYLRPDAAMLGDSELAADYDYVFYNQAHLVSAHPDAIPYGEIKRAMFNRTWEHFTSHRHAPVGETLDAPIAVRKGSVLYFSAPLFGAYQAWDFWAYRAMAVELLRDFLPPALVIPNTPGWVEVTVHDQPAAADHAERKIIHVVAYHPRRTTQTIPHVDQSWATSGLSVKVRMNGTPIERVYLAPQMQELTHSINGDYAVIELPPVGAHAVIVVDMQRSKENL